MNSEKFTFQNSLEANYLNVRLDPGDRLDEIAVKVIRKDCPDFLIPFRIVSVNEEASLKYRLINTVALEYAEMTLPKVLFVQLYLNLLEPFVKGRDWFLDYHHFCVDTRYVYVDKHTWQVFYLYVPVSSFCSTDQEILDFFKNVFMSIMISDDKDFQVRLFRFFGGGHITLAGLYQLMQEEKGITASSQPVFQQTGGQQSFRQPAHQQASWQSSNRQMPSGQSADQPVTLSQSENQQQAFSQSESRQQAFSQSVKSAGDNKKKDSTDSRKKDKKQILEKNPAASPEPGAGYGAGGDEDEVMQALFGNHKKSNKKEKPPAESKKAEKDSNGKKQEEKGRGGFGGLFGGKKKQQTVDSAQSRSAELTAGSGAQAVCADGQQVASMGGYASGVADYGAMYDGNGFGSDETEVYADEAAAAGAPWLELIDFSQPGALQRIDLNFTKPYITIGRMSSDEKRPDVVFPAEFKRIGRQHARIERRGNDLYVIDLGSANHTLVNGQVMVPNQPYQLRDGMELAFTASKPVRYRVHI